MCSLSDVYVMPKEQRATFGINLGVINRCMSDGSEKEKKLKVDRELFHLLVLPPFLGKKGKR